MKPFVLLETNWKNVNSEKYEIALIPWGATEPHNYHLPYGTDALETQKIAELSAARAWKDGAKVMVLPAVPFGIQNPGQTELPFCLNISVTTQMAILKDLVNVLYGQGIRKIIILNGHGGNEFKSLIREIQAEYIDLFIGLMEWFRMEEAFAHFELEGDHAGEAETSIMQYLYPELVLPLDEAGEGKSAGFRLKGLSDRTAWTPRNWTRVSRDTGVGNPLKATPEKGKHCVDILVEKISGFLVELSDCDISDIYVES